MINIGTLIIAVIIGALLFSTYKKAPEALPSHSSTTSADSIPVNPDVNLSKIPQEAATVHNDFSKDTVCKSMHSSYQYINEVKKLKNVDLRFVNIHKKVDGIVYRLRFFYKESSENEIPNYLVYKENQKDEDILVEKSSYKKGKLYLKVENDQGEIVYSEEGLNVGAEKDLFLHYENKVLKDLQGVSPLQGEKNFIECRF